MRNKMNLLVGTLLVCSLAVAVGCESVGNPTLRKMFGPASKMDPWVGKHRDELVNNKEWGLPLEERPSEDGVRGGRTLVYDKSFRMPGQHFKYETACLIFIHTDAKGIVRSWSYEGC